MKHDTWAQSGIAGVLRAAAVVLLGFVLMFVGHLLAFAGFLATRGTALRLPYWWSYLLIYPMAGLVLARRGVISGWRAAACLCAAPVLYFLLLGILEGRWDVSDFALLGGIVATLITGLVARGSGRVLVALLLCVPSYLASVETWAGLPCTT